jgi:hypothetical protein
MRGTWDRTRTYVKELFVPDFFTDGGTGQGSGTFFLITAKDSFNNGQPMNRFGQIYGRKFYRSCSDMPGNLPQECGDGKAFQVNDRGYVVWVGAGNSWKDGITKNLWQTYLPAAQSPFGPKVPLYFGMPIVDRPLAGQPNAGIGFNEIIGNVFPDYRFSYSNSLTYKRITLYGLLDATIGQSIYNQGEQWGLWISARRTSTWPTARSRPRSQSVTGGAPAHRRARAWADSATRSIRTTTTWRRVLREDPELSASYHFGSVGGVGDWSVGFVGRNLATFTNYTGLDPEVGATVAQATQARWSTARMRSASPPCAPSPSPSPRASRSRP